MNTSKFLGKVIGIYLTIVSISFLINSLSFDNYLKDIVTDTPLLITIGFFTLILGILMVIAHNVWQWNWRVVITIIGWIVLIKGASLVLYPQFVQQIFIAYTHNTAIDVGSILNLIIGILLIYFGCRRDN